MPKKREAIVPGVQPATADEKHECPDDEQRGATEWTHNQRFAPPPNIMAVNRTPKFAFSGGKTKSSGSPGPGTKGTRPDIGRFLGTTGTVVTRCIV